MLDVEKLWEPVPAGANMLAWMRDTFEAGDELFGRPGILYTNPATLQYWLYLKSVPDWLAKHPLWLAHYGASKPNPFPFKTWSFWQFTDKGDGARYAMQSKGLDLNTFNGTMDQLLAFAGKKEPPHPADITPRVGLSLDEKIDRLWKAHPELHE